MEPQVGVVIGRWSLFGGGRTLRFECNCHKLGCVLIIFNYCVVYNIVNKFIMYCGHLNSWDYKGCTLKLVKFVQNIFIQIHLILLFHSFPKNKHTPN
jgi:hypothetical protein